MPYWRYLRRRGLTCLFPLLLGMLSYMPRLLLSLGPLLLSGRLAFRSATGCILTFLRLYRCPVAFFLYLCFDLDAKEGFQELLGRIGLGLGWPRRFGSCFPDMRLVGLFPALLRFARGAIEHTARFLGQILWSGMFLLFLRIAHGLPLLKFLQDRRHNDKKDNYESEIAVHTI